MTLMTQDGLYSHFEKTKLSQDVQHETPRKSVRVYDALTDVNV